VGSALGRGVSEGPAPRRRERLAVSAQQRQRQHGKGRGGPTKSDVMKEDRREQSEQSSDQVKFGKHGH
jgi:hypothetical protein